MLGHRSKESVEVFDSLAVSLFDHASNLLALYTDKWKAFLEQIQRQHAKTKLLYSQCSNG